MSRPLDDQAIDTLFRSARTQNKWLDKPVTLDQLRVVYELVKWGPTSANSFPVRLVFVTGEEGKQRLRPLVYASNQERVMTAPATLIIGYDTHFWEWLPRLFPHRDMSAAFVDKPDFAELTGLRNSSLQSGYLIMAPRSLGLDCGPMSGFDNEAVDREFFPGGRVKSNFLCAIGYGDPSELWDRLPRPDFDEVCAVV